MQDHCWTDDLGSYPWVIPPRLRSSDTLGGHAADRQTWERGETVTNPVQPAQDAPLVFPAVAFNPVGFR